MDYNDSLAMVTGSAGRTPGQSGGLLGRFLTDRQDAQGQRLANLFDDVTGITQSAPSFVDDLSKSQKAIAGPLYQAADPVMVPAQNLGPMLDDPALMTGLKKGLTEELRRLRADAALAMNAGDITKANALRAKVDELVGIGAKLGDEWPAEIPTRWLDLARRGLGDMIEAGKRTGSEPVGSLIQAKDALTKIVSDVNPDYGKAIAAWAGPAALKDAVEEGAQAFATGKMGPDDVAAMWRGLTPEKQQAFKVGVVDYIRGVARGADGKNKVAALLGNENMRQKLAQIFTPDEMARIESFRTAERAITEATRKAVGGSPTAKNLASDADLATDASAIADLLSPGGWGRQIANWAAGVAKGMPDAVAQNVVKTTATKTAQEALDRIARLRAVAAAQALKQANPFRNPAGLVGGIVAAPSTSQWPLPLLWATTGQ